MRHADTTADQKAWRGTIGQLPQQSLEEFLARGQLCRLAMLDNDGWPYVVPVWFEWDPATGNFWIIAREKSAWAGYLSHDPRVALTIDEESAPYRKVTVRGLAEVVEPPNTGGRWVEIAFRMARRYLGEHGPEYLASTLEEPRWLFQITPTAWKTWQGVAWHQRYRVSSGKGDGGDDAPRRI